MNVILSFPSALFFKRAANGRRDSKQFLSDSDDSQVFIERETVRVQHTQSILHLNICLFLYELMRVCYLYYL